MQSDFTDVTYVYNILGFEIKYLKSDKAYRWKT